MKNTSVNNMAEQFAQAMPTSRRGFLKAGILGGAGLSIAGASATLTGCSNVPEGAMGDYKFLRPQDREFFAALVPAVIASGYPGELKEQAILRTIKALDDLIFTLNEFNRVQMRQLFDALSMAPIRFAMGGPWASWKDAAVKQVDDFLISWRDSSIQLKRMGYVSLAKLIGICWYSQPENYASVGYPGPPTKIPVEPVKKAPVETVPTASLTGETDV